MASPLGWLASPVGLAPSLLGWSGVLAAALGTCVLGPLDRTAVLLAGWLAPPLVGLAPSLVTGIADFTERHA